MAAIRTAGQLGLQSAADPLASIAITRFGVNVIREQDGTITHNMRTTVIGADGKVVSVYEGSEWTPAQILDDMRRSLAR